MFHVRRRPADCAPRKRKKKPGALGTNAANPRDVRGDSVPLLVELGPDGSAPLPGDTARTIRLTGDVMEVGSANGIALQLYGPHIQPRHCVITNAEGVTSLTPCHADAHTYVNGQRIHQTTILSHGSLIKFGHSNTYRFLDPSQEDGGRTTQARHPAGSALDNNSRIYDSRSPRALSPTSAEPSVRENIVETTFDLEGNVETISTTSGAREDNRSLGSASENRLSGMDRYPRGQDPILPAVLEFPEDPQEQFLARVITHLDVTQPTFRLAPAYTLYLCARYRASTHYRPELTPTERAHKLTVLLQHAAMLIRHTVQDRSTESTSQAFWLANASELLHFLKSDRHVSAFSLQAQDTLADAVQLAFKNLVACLTDELNTAMTYLMSVTGDDHPREVVNILSGAMNLLRKCRVNAALTIQLFSQLFHWISAKALANVISNSNLCTRSFGNKLFNRLRNLQAWAESQGLELAAECHLAKIVQCSHLMQAPKYAPEELANLSSACFKLNSMQLGALLRQYKPEPGEKLAPPAMLEQAAKAAESVADELARAEGRDVTLYEDPAPPLQLLLPDDGFSCDVVQGVPPGLADFLHPLQSSGLCRLAAQPTSSGHWTVYMTAARSPSALSTTQPEVQVIRLHKAGGGMGLSIVAAKGAGQERLGIYIKSVVPGGAADRDGRLAAGDQLLSVDGQSLLGITQEKAAEFLVRTGSVVTLEVAKGGAVYHGLATLLQQPSPTPHRALDFYSDQQPYYYDGGSQESLYSLQSYRLFTPPATKPKNNVFFNSDDNLYKREMMRKLTIPRIEIGGDEPVFNLQVTDFSEPSPKNVILTYDETGTSLEKVGEFLPELESSTQNHNKSWKDRSNNFVQQKSHSIDIHEHPMIDIEQISETDKFLSISAKKFKQQKYTSGSLQDLSSSTSSINSGVHESNLDLSHIDPDTPVRHWKSPDEVRHCYENKESRQNKAMSLSELNTVNKKFSRLSSNRSKSVSEENLNDKLTEYERLEILKLLHDWSLNGSDSKSDFNWKLSANPANRPNLCPSSSLEHIEKENLEEPEKKLGRGRVKFVSEPDLSPKKRDSSSCAAVTKYSSVDNLGRCKSTTSKSTPVGAQFVHKCQFMSELDLSPKRPPDYSNQGPIFITKYSSVDNLGNFSRIRNGGLSRTTARDSEFMHKCQFRNCIFNEDFCNVVNRKPTQSGTNETNHKTDQPSRTNFLASGIQSDLQATNSCGSVKPKKSILKNSGSQERLLLLQQDDIECLSNITNLQNAKSRKLGPNSRRHSEIIDVKPFNSQLVRCDSLERLTHIQSSRASYTSSGTSSTKKFPESYIVTRKNKNVANLMNNNNNNNNNNENLNGSNQSPKKSPKVVVLKRKYLPKTWKSCSDIKNKRTTTVRKCCKYAKKNCPILQNCVEAPTRKTQSLANIGKNDEVLMDNTSKHQQTTRRSMVFATEDEDRRAFEADFSPAPARLDGLVDFNPIGACSRPRRMSERDLPSRVDSERTIPSSKSVPALHHISPTTEHAPPPTRTASGPGPLLSSTSGNAAANSPNLLNNNNNSNSHDVFNPGYSRTSSSNSINAGPLVGGGAPSVGANVNQIGSNGHGPMVVPNSAAAAAAALRSARSTHSLHSQQQSSQQQQQQDGGFYQNLSVYRNKIPSPQHLGDRTSALRSSQNSLQSSAANNGNAQQQRPSSAYYPPPSMSSNAQQRPNNLHQSIPNLKSPPSIHRLHNIEDGSRTMGSYPSANQLQQQQQVYSQQAGYGPSGQPQQYYAGRHGEDPIMSAGGISGKYSQNSPYHLQSQQNLVAAAGGIGGGGGGSSSSYPSPTHAMPALGMQQHGSQQQMQHLHTNGAAHRELQQLESRYSNGNNVVGAGGSTVASAGLLMREDQFRQSQAARHDEIMGQRQHDDMMMRVSKSDDMLKHHTVNNNINNANSDMMRYASSGNIRAHESNKVEIPSLYHHRMKQAEDEDIVGGMSPNNNTNMRTAPLQQQQHLGMKMPVDPTSDALQHQSRRRQQQQPNSRPMMTAQQQSGLSAGTYAPPHHQRSEAANQNSAAYYTQQQQQQQYYQAQQQQQQQHHASSSQQPGGSGQGYGMHVMAQSMQNLSLSQQQQQQQQNPYQYYQQQQQQQHSGGGGPPPISPTYKSPPIAPNKPTAKQPQPQKGLVVGSSSSAAEDLLHHQQQHQQQQHVSPPEPPPTTTHPLYSASSQDGPPKMAFYPTNSSGMTTASSKTPRDPWAREEQERQAEARREASRQWQEQQIKELMALPHRTQQQEEQLRALQLEREFQRRAAIEAADQDDEDTEKESPSPSLTTPTIPPSVIVAGTQQQQPALLPTPTITTPSTSNHNNTNSSSSSSNVISSSSSSSRLHHQSQPHGRERERVFSGSGDETMATIGTSVAPPTSILKPIGGLGLSNSDRSDRLSNMSTVAAGGTGTNLSSSSTAHQHNNIHQPALRHHHNQHDPQQSYQHNNIAQQHQQPSPTESNNSGSGPASAAVAVAPPPPERGSSFAIMSTIRTTTTTKDSTGIGGGSSGSSTTKRVSFNDTSSAALINNGNQQQQHHHQPPTTLHLLEETIREDPNSFIRQAESMLASPASPSLDACSPGGTAIAGSGLAVATPGVIGAQEVYRDPRARRLAEQAQQKNQSAAPVPEKLSFKEKMKMFAMETGEQETPKDKSKISRAQRDIDNLSSPAGAAAGGGGAPSSGMVH